MGAATPLSRPRVPFASHLMQHAFGAHRRVDGALHLPNCLVLLGHASLVEAGVDLKAGGDTKRIKSQGCEEGPDAGGRSPGPWPRFGERGEAAAKGGAHQQDREALAAELLGEEDAGDIACGARHVVAVVAALVRVLRGAPLARARLAQERGVVGVSGHQVGRARTFGDRRARQPPPPHLRGDDDDLGAGRQLARVDEGGVDSQRADGADVDLLELLIEVECVLEHELLQA